MKHLYLFVRIYYWLRFKQANNKFVFFRYNIYSDYNKTKVKP